MDFLKSIVSDVLTNNPKSKNRFLYQIGQDFFHIEIWIYNFLPGSSPVQIPFAFVQELNIEETLYDWNTKGYLILKNDTEMWERGAPDYSSDASLSSLEGLLTFRSDARTRMSIKIFSYVEENDNLQDSLPEEWTMNFDTIIYHIDDVTDSTNPTLKLKKLYFQDERFVILSERNLEWSTTLANPNLQQTDTDADPVDLNATDAERSLPGSEAISLLLNSVGTFGFSDSNGLNVGYDPRGSIDKPNIPFSNIVQSFWDKSSEEENSKIFYCSPANSNALQDLNYLLSFTASSDGFPVILDFGRHVSDRGWKLLSLSHFFKNSQNYQIEKMSIVDGSDPSESPPHLERSFYNPTDISSVKNFTSGTASFIKNYFFSNMSPMDDYQIKNSPLFYYDFANGEYKILYEKNSIGSVLKKAKELIKMGLYSGSKLDNPQVLINLNQTKVKGIATKNVLVTQRGVQEDLPTLRALMDLVFLNQALNFQVNGLTFREPGKFLYIDRLTYSSSKFDDKFLGQWLIIKVNHIFREKSYVNDIVCTKIDSLSNLGGETTVAY